jgi:hypothetical protein
VASIAFLLLPSHLLYKKTRIIVLPALALGAENIAAGRGVFGGWPRGSWERI